jgi:hypothetical protein
MMNRKVGSRGLIEVLSQHLNGGTGDNHEKQDG